MFLKCCSIISDEAEKSSVVVQGCHWPGKPGKVRMFGGKSRAVFLMVGKNDINHVVRKTLFTFSGLTLLLWFWPCLCDLESGAATLTTLLCHLADSVIKMWMLQIQQMHVVPQAVDGRAVKTGGEFYVAKWIGSSHARTTIAYEPAGLGVTQCSSGNPPVLPLCHILTTCELQIFIFQKLCVIVLPWKLRGCRQWLLTVCIDDEDFACLAAYCCQLCSVLCAELALFCWCCAAVRISIYRNFSVISRHQSSTDRSLHTGWS